MQVFVFWLSVNIAAVDVTLGMLAPTLFGLGFRDAALCAVFGSMLGSVPVAYIATWGPRSGNRTMVTHSWRKATRGVGTFGKEETKCVWRHTDFWIGLCEVYDGMVAEPIGGIAESDNFTRLFLDQQCDSGSNLQCSFPK